LFEVCEGLEADKLAYERISDAQGQRNGATSSRVRPRPLLSLHRFIHEAVVAAADNSVLSGLYELVTGRMRRARCVTRMKPTTSRTRLSSPRRS